MAKGRRRWVKWVVSAAVLVVVVAVGGPFVYIHFIEDKAPPAFHLSDRRDRGSAVPVAGRWKVTSGSEAGYRVQEKLAGQANTAFGRTSKVSGTLTVAGKNVTAGSFTVDMASVHSDQSRRDDQFRTRVMDTASFPTSRFVLAQPIALRTIPPPGKTIKAQAVGKLTLRGTTKTVTIPLTARRDGARLTVVGSLPITFADWGISNPSNGFAETEDHGTLEVQLRFAKA